MTNVDKKKIEKYKNLILDIPGIKEAEYVNSTTSSVTLSWGVEWSPDYIARDIIQNFRDANHTAETADSDAPQFGCCGRGINCTDGHIQNRSCRT